MRWFKHMTAAHMDGEMDRLLEECGAEIYGVYWLILEDIGSAMEPGRMAPSAIHSDSKWAQIARVQPRIWRSSRDQLAKKLLNMSRTEDNRLQISAPNLLKYKDEYARKSGQTQELNRADTDTDTDTEQKQSGASAPRVRDALQNGIANGIGNAPRWKSDPDFRSFRDSASSAWLDLIDSDFEESYKIWRTMDFEQRLACIKAIEARVGMAMDFKFVPRPAKFLQSREYYRPIVPTKPTVIDQSRSQSLAVMDAMKKARKC